MSMNLWKGGNLMSSAVYLLEKMYVLANNTGPLMLNTDE